MSANILHNRLGLADAGALERAEADFTNARALELLDSPIGGAFDFERRTSAMAMSCLLSWRPCMDGGIAIDALHDAV
jgi:hypothetical protein